MLTTQIYNIPGQPVAMGRPRFSKMGRAYLPKKTREALKHFRSYLLDDEGNLPEQMQGAIALEVIFIMKRPKSMMAKKYSFERLLHIKRPDLDNLVKLVADALQPVVVPDDSQIVMVNASKWYAAKDEEPKTMVLLRCIEQL